MAEHSQADYEYLSETLNSDRRSPDERYFNERPAQEPFKKYSQAENPQV